jgi:hypothetical protein
MSRALLGRRHWLLDTGNSGENAAPSPRRLARPPHAARPTSLPHGSTTSAFPSSTQATQAASETDGLQELGEDFLHPRFATRQTTMASPPPYSGTHAGILRLARNDAAHMPTNIGTENDLGAVAANLKADSASGAAASAAALPRLATLARKRVLTMGMVLALDVAASPSLTVTSLCITFLQVRWWARIGLSRASGGRGWWGPGATLQPADARIAGNPSPRQPVSCLPCTRAASVLHAHIYHHGVHGSRTRAVAPCARAGHSPVRGRPA